MNLLGNTSLKLCNSHVLRVTDGEPTLSIPMLLTWALRMTPSYVLIKQGCFLMLICCLLGIYVIYVYILHHCNKILSLRKNQHKTIIITICKTEYRENNSHFCRCAGNKTNSAVKFGPCTTNINRKAAAPIGKISLPLNSFFFI